MVNIKKLTNTTKMHIKTNKPKIQQNINTKNLHRKPQKNKNLTKIKLKRNSNPKHKN